jgi:dienelactone hydrolase
VTAGAISGHSMGAIGAILAAAAEPRVGALVASSSPAGPYRLTRLTFQLAHLPIPDPIAYPLAWLTTHVYLRPRGHRVPDISATSAIARYAGPILLAHGDQDSVVPVSHLVRLAAAVRKARLGDPAAATLETLIVAGGEHSWLYEDAGYRRTVARMLSRALGGPFDPEVAGEIAAATRAERLPEGEGKFAAMEDVHGGLRTLVRVALPGATRRQTVDEREPDGGGVDGAVGAEAPRAEASPVVGRNAVER